MNGERVSNIDPTTLKNLREGYADGNISDEQVFHFIYGYLSDPEYQKTFGAETRKDLPRVAWPETLAEFRATAATGGRLAALHLGWRDAEPYPLEEEWTDRDLLEEADRTPTRMRFLTQAKDRLRINGHLTLAGIPPESYEWKLGAKAALETFVDAANNLIKRQGAGRRDWVRMIGKVVRVSIESCRRER